MCSELSSGQRTLVGIVKATLHEPALLVLDEPTASLDPDIALKVRAGLLDVLRDDGAALLVTSHDMREVEMLTERVDLPRPRRGRRRRLAGRDRRARTATTTSKACSSTLAEDARAMRSPMSWHRIRVVIRRHAYVLWRAPHRWFDIAFWPLMDVILWGSLGAYVAQQDGASRGRGAVPDRRDHDVPHPVPEPDRRRDRASWRRPGAATCSTC